MRILFVIGIISLLMISCEKSTSNCTEEFRVILISIVGDTLDAAFSIRLATGDTLNYQNWNLEPNTFIVVDDNLTAALRDKTEQFLFLGFKRDSLFVSQTFEITSDGCHVSKVSGPQVIYL